MVLMPSTPAVNVVTATKHIGTAVTHAYLVLLISCDREPRQIPIIFCEELPPVNERYKPKFGFDNQRGAAILTQLRFLGVERNQYATCLPNDHGHVSPRRGTVCVGSLAHSPPITERPPGGTAKAAASESPNLLLNALVEGG